VARDWSSWQELVDPSVGVKGFHDPAVGRNKDGRLEVFVIGDDGNLWHTWQQDKYQVGMSSTWSNWSNLGRPIDAEFHLAPVVRQDNDGRLEVFAVCRHKQSDTVALWHRWQDTPNEGWCPKWDSLGSPLGKSINSAYGQNLAVGRNQDGRLQDFVLDSDGRIWHRWQWPPQGRGWHGKWEELKLSASQDEAYIGVAVARNQDGRLEVFANDRSGNIWHRWQESANGPWNEHWDRHNLGALPIIRKSYTALVENNQDGRLEIFLVEIPDSDHPQNFLWHKWQQQPNKAWIDCWHGLVSPPVTYTASPAVKRTAEGQLAFFAVWSGEIWHRWQKTPNGRWIEHWDNSLGSPPGVKISQFDVGQYNDGELEIFALGAGYATKLWHKGQKP
jgi:hypothetical protein